MKIAILGTKGVPGHHGVEVVVDSLLPHLAALGNKVTVYGYDSYTSTVENYHGAEIKALPGSSNKNFEMLSHMLNSSIDVRKDNFDIIHIHSTDPCLLSWLPKSKYGTVATSHGQAYIRKKWGITAKMFSRVAEKLFIYIPKIITSVSKPLAEHYTAKYKKDVIYIPNGIEFRKIPSDDFLTKWSLAPRKFIFCSAGRIEHTKGLHTLIEAWRKLRLQYPLVIAGGGSGTDTKYFEKIKQNSPAGVKFVGFLTGDELFALYAFARIFVFPSEYEAMSMALLEGLSFGTPTLYSNIPENEAVAKGLGYPFKVSDSDSMVEALNSVLCNYDGAIKIGQKAKKTIKKNHDWSLIAKQYHQLYLKLSH